MNQVIRHGIFETNSSSSHSITIQGGEYIPDRLPPDGDGVLRIFGGEFGWGFDEFHDAASKASYCMTYVMDKGCQLAEERAELLKRVLAEVTGAGAVVFADEEDGYIDHQSGPSEGDVCADAFATPATLRDFIFNPRSVLTIDNDNH